MSMSGFFEEDNDEFLDDLEEEHRSRFIKSDFLSIDEIKRIRSKNVIVEFTQYLLPYGNPRKVTTEVPESLKRYVDDLKFAGAEFECEMLRTGDVSFTIEYQHNPNDEDDIETLAHEVCPNDESVTEALKNLIVHAWNRLQEINLEAK